MAPPDAGPEETGPAFFSPGERYAQRIEFFILVKSILHNAHYIGAGFSANYTTLLQQGFSGYQSITIREMLDQGGNLEISGGLSLSNEAYELGIFSIQPADIRRYFHHNQRFLPLE